MHSRGGMRSRAGAADHGFDQHDDDKLHGVKWWPLSRLPSRFKVMTIVGLLMWTACFYVYMGGQPGEEDQVLDQDFDAQGTEEPLAAGGYGISPPGEEEGSLEVVRSAIPPARGDEREAARPGDGGQPPGGEEGEDRQDEEGEGEEEQGELDGGGGADVEEGDEDEGEDQELEAELDDWDVGGEGDAAGGEDDDDLPRSGKTGAGGADKGHGAAAAHGKGTAGSKAAMEEGAGAHAADEVVALEEEHGAEPEMTREQRKAEIRAKYDEAYKVVTQLTKLMEVKIKMDLTDPTQITMPMERFARLQRQAQRNVTAVEKEFEAAIVDLPPLMVGKLRRRIDRTSRQAEQQAWATSRRGGVDSVAEILKKKGGKTIPVTLLTQEAHQVSGDRFLGLDPEPGTSEEQPFLRGVGKVVSIARLLERSPYNNSFEYEGCGLLHVVVTGRDGDGRMSTEWPPTRAAPPVEWPPTGGRNANALVLVVDGRSAEGVEVVNLGEMCARIADKSVDIVAGEVEGDASPCRMSVRHHTLLYGFHDRPYGYTRDLRLGCRVCNFAPSVFLAKAYKMARVGPWPVLLRPYARVAFFLRSHGHLNVLQCNGVAAARHPKQSLDDHMHVDSYNRLHKIGEKYKFRRVVSKGGFVRWLGCARSANACLQKRPTDPPPTPSHLPCCAHLAKRMVETVASHLDAMGVQWQLWRSALLGGTRDAGYLPWRSRFEIAVSATAARRLPALLFASMLHDGQYMVAMFKSNMAIMHVAPIAFWYPPEVWKGFRVEAGIGGRIVEEGEEASWDAPHILRTASVNCRAIKRSANNKCISSWQPTFMSVTWVEPVVGHPPAEKGDTGEEGQEGEDEGGGGHKDERQERHKGREQEKPWLERIQVEGLSLPARSDRKKLLSFWYGQDWGEPSCDWETGLGACSGF